MNMNNEFRVQPEPGGMRVWLEYHIQFPAGLPESVQLERAAGSAKQALGYAMAMGKQETEDAEEEVGT